MTDIELFESCWSPKFGAHPKAEAQRRFLLMCAQIDMCRPHLDQGIQEFQVLEAGALLRQHMSDVKTDIDYHPWVLRPIRAGQADIAKRHLVGLYNEQRLIVHSLGGWFGTLVLVGLVVLTLALVVMNG